MVYIILYRSLANNELTKYPNVCSAVNLEDVWVTACIVSTFNSKNSWYMDLEYV